MTQTAEEFDIESQEQRNVPKCMCCEREPHYFDRFIYVDVPNRYISKLMCIDCLITAKSANIGVVYGWRTPTVNGSRYP